MTFFFPPLPLQTFIFFVRVCVEFPALGLLLWPERVVHEQCSAVTGLELCESVSKDVGRGRRRRAAHLGLAQLLLQQVFYLQTEKGKW